MAIYLDCNATTPVEPSVADAVMRYTRDEYGNAGSRTHEFGIAAKLIVQRARGEVASLVACGREDVIFTSGATEANNIAILGLASFGLSEGKTHIVTSRIEHKAVLEPFEHMGALGFEITYIDADESGRLSVKELRDALRDDTLLVSLMQANNETGIRQPINEICQALQNHPSYLHVDAAQGFGKDIEPLTSTRIDLISASAHKVYGPKGIGALISRPRGYDRLPLNPIMHGGGQERGLRPGTLPVPLIAGFGEAVTLARKDHSRRKEACLRVREKAVRAFDRVGVTYTGDQDWAMEHVLNVRFGDANSEAVIVCLKDLVAISNGSACTSRKYTPSHVLLAMGMTEDEANCCVRISWSHMTPEVDWDGVADRIQSLLN